MTPQTKENHQHAITSTQIRNNKRKTIRQSPRNAAFLELRFGLQPHRQLRQQLRLRRAPRALGPAPAPPRRRAEAEARGGEAEAEAGDTSRAPGRRHGVEGGGRGVGPGGSRTERAAEIGRRRLCDSLSRNNVHEQVISATQSECFQLEPQCAPSIMVLHVFLLAVASDMQPSENR